MLVISFLVAVISMAASLFTLYSTYWFPGELKVTLPYPGDNIGFSYDDRVKILIPISFTNTGSTRSRAQVYEIKAIISTPDGNKTKFETRWDYAASKNTLLDIKPGMAAIRMILSSTLRINSFTKVELSRSK